MKIICIAGASGSGKTTFALKLKHSLPEVNICVMDMDSFYRQNSHMQLDDRQHLNYDHPEIIEYELLARMLQELKQGKTIEIPQYDFTIHDRSDKTKRIDPPDVVIVEGIFGLYYDEITEQSDLNIFMEIEDDIAIGRRFVRDIHERGRDAQSVLQQYLETVRPMYHKYIKDTREKADIIIRSNRAYTKVLEMMRIYLEHD